MFISVFRALVNSKQVLSPSPVPFSFLVPTLMCCFSESNILETSSCNLFIVSNGVLYTPGLAEGCIAGTMRMQVINLAIQNGIKVYECAILPQHLLAADEIFLTNAIRGINWIGGYRTKRYPNNMSRKLVVLLNEYWEKQLEL